MEVLRRDGLARKHGALVGLLNKLATSHYELAPLELDQSRPFVPEEVKNITLDRTWYLSQVSNGFIRFLYLLECNFFFFFNYVLTK